MRVLVFGASTVEGWWDSQGGWVDRLKHDYNQRQVTDWSKKQLRIMNLGVAGQTSTDLLGRMEHEANTRAKNYERGIAILISVGSNDAAIRGGQETKPEEFSDNLKQLLDSAKNLTERVIFIGFPAVNEDKTNPLIGTEHYFKNERIKSFEDIAKRLCDELKIPFIPVHDHFTEKMASGVLVNAEDGLHPNDAGHQLIFELVRPALDGLLAAHA